MLKRSDKNHAVRRLQAELCLGGFDAKPIDGAFGRGTAAAVKSYQSAMGLSPTGEANLRTQRSLGLNGPDPTSTPVPVLDQVTVDVVRQIFSPATPRRNIEKYLPAILDALAAAKMDDRDLVLMALATIRAETEGFVPIDEGRSKYNTDPDAAPFNRYDDRLGNRGPGEGARFKGRGFIQLTGRDNYTKQSERLGLGTLLVDKPSKANDTRIAARVLASFIHAKRTAIKYALYGRDMNYARRLVNGGVHGIDRFVEAFESGQRLLASGIEPAEPAAIEARDQLPMEILVDRFVSDADATISRILVDGQFLCFGLEDEYREEKLAGETRIPAGRYPLRLRTEGGFHERYRKRYGAMHRGMLHIQKVPGFTFILIHCGNTDEDTRGCLLVGTDAITRPGEMSITSSRAAYERFYPFVVDAAARGALTIRFEDSDRR